MKRDDLHPVSAPFGYRYAYFKDSKGKVTRYLLDEIDAHHNVRTFPDEWSFDQWPGAKNVEDAQTPQLAAIKGAEQNEVQKNEKALAETGAPQV